MMPNPPPIAGPDQADIRTEMANEIRAAMVEGMAVAEARHQQAGAWLNGGLPEVVQDPPAVVSGADGAS